MTVLQPNYVAKMFYLSCNSVFMVCLNDKSTLKTFKPRRGLQKLEPSAS